MDLEGLERTWRDLERLKLTWKDIKGLGKSVTDRQTATQTDTPTPREACTSDKGTEIYVNNMRHQISRQKMI